MSNKPYHTLIYQYVILELKLHTYVFGASIECVKTSNPWMYGGIMYSKYAGTVSVLVWKEPLKFLQNKMLALSQKVVTPSKSNLPL